MQKSELSGEPATISQKPKRKIIPVERQSCPKCGSPMEARKIWTSPAGIQISMCTVCRFYTKSRSN